MDLLVSRDDIRQVFLDELPSPALAPGQVRLRVDHFSLTANNITYAVAGDFLNYWDFFPAPEGKGRVPVWGFGEVIESLSDEVEVGSRFYGYYPMSPELIAEPTSVSRSGFTDGSEHRKGLSYAYNRYLNTKDDPAYEADTEEMQMLFRPLFGTAFLIDDFLAEEGFFGAERVILASASSKTAYSTAFQIAKRAGISLTGLTSARNVDYVKSLGSYDEVLSYDEIEALAKDVPSVLVDMAGNSELRGRVHKHLGEALKYSCSVGISHWDQNAPAAEPIPGPTPTMFFAPDQSVKRIKELGAEEFNRRYSAAWKEYLGKARNWVTIERFSSGEDLKKNYLAFIEGTAPANAGYIHKI